jgi:hypothetical protein
MLTLEKDILILHFCFNYSYYTQMLLQIQIYVWTMSTYQLEVNKCLNFKVVKCLIIFICFLLFDFYMTKFKFQINIKLILKK